MMRKVSVPVVGPEAEVRRRAVDNAIGTSRIEGLEASPAAREIFERYAAGEITLEEMGAAVDAIEP
ncbi:MAG TPA: antitoxin VbhA family protein [Candidatus Acidoferrales bacterium]|nr:antitoxin VbhA family protein [Candidatus Acidoferrales bacterium]